MSDEDNATRAPEFDAQSQAQPSVISSNDTPAQTGPTMGEHCTTDRPLASASPQGEVTEFNGIATYVSKPASYPSEPSKLLLLLTGGTGLHSPNNQTQADLYAARGFVVIMPDQFEDDIAPNTGAVSPTAANSMQDGEGTSSILERFKMGAAETAKSFMIDMWLARQTPEKVLPRLRKVLDAAQETFADAVANGGGVYGVGYCVGAKYLLSLLSPIAPIADHPQPSSNEEAAPAAKVPELKCGAIAHGAMVTREDLEAVKRPLYVVAVAEDSLFPDDVREQGKASLELNAIEHDVRVFEGVPHGFAVVGDYAEASIKEKQREAFEAMTVWLESH